MDLKFSDEQEMLRDAVRGICERLSDSERVRELEGDAVGYSVELWRELAQMDLLGLTIPTEYGGSGMTALEQVIVFMELGRAIAPVPALPTVGFAAPLLVASGSDAQKQQWLPRIAGGEAILSLAWLEPNRGEGAEGVQLAAKPDGDVVRLSGTKMLVPFAASADALVVIARTGDAERDLTLYLVDPKADGVRLEPTATTSGDASYEVTFDDVEIDVEALIGDVGAGWELFLHAMEETLVYASALAVGGTEKVLDLTVEYAKERVQFGVPIGSFQGIAHPIANVATDLQGARTLVFQAAWGLSQERRRLALSAMTKFHAAETYRMATRVGHQTFGGIGFTMAIDMQLYFRRAKQLELTWFGPGALLEFIAAAELDAEVPMISTDLSI